MGKNILGVCSLPMMETVEHAQTAVHLLPLFHDPQQWQMWQRSMMHRSLKWTFDKCAIRFPEFHLVRCKIIGHEPWPHWLACFAHYHHDCVVGANLLLSWIPQVAPQLHALFIWVLYPQSWLSTCLEYQPRAANCSCLEWWGPTRKEFA